MYYYYVGSNNLYQEMTNEAVQDFKTDSIMTKIAKTESKLIYRSPKEVLQDRIKKEYGRAKWEFLQKFAYRKHLKLTTELKTNHYNFFKIVKF